MNKTLEQRLTDWVESGFKTCFAGHDLSDIKMNVVATTEESFGDYQCNGAMALAKQLKKNPREIAQTFVDQTEIPPYLEKAEIAGPGFINLFLSTSGLAEQAEAMSKDDRLAVPAIGDGQVIVIDYSSPNVAKPMHIGHIRSTVIGNALDRMHRFLGYEVIADNHVGDWGTQFGLIILGYKTFVDEDALASGPIEELERIYVKSYERSKEDEEWLNAAREELVKLQQGDETNRALWRKCVDLSLGEFEKVYTRLGISFDLVRGESFYNDKLAGILEELNAKGLLVESEGAKVVDLEDEKLSVCIVQKSDGGFNYATTDLATVKSRMDEFSPVAILYVTDERQQHHFKQFFAVGRKLGWEAHTVHIWFGLMRLPEGTFSTRQGNVIKLEMLLDEAESRALEVVKGTSPDMAEEQQKEVARAVGLGAIKYADLSQNPQSLITFSWEKALALEGNSAPYLLYAYARSAKLQGKYKEAFPDIDLADYAIRLEEPVERRLALRLLRFPETLIRATENYRPNLIADYLFEIAQLYSSFYQNVPKILETEEGLRESRIKICELVARVLKQGLNLLGIETPERI